MQICPCSTAGAAGQHHHLQKLRNTFITRLHYTMGSYNIGVIQQFMSEPDIDSAMLLTLIYLSQLLVRQLTNYAHLVVKKPVAGLVHWVEKSQAVFDVIMFMRLLLLCKSKSEILKHHVDCLFNMICLVEPVKHLMNMLTRLKK